MRPSAVSAVSDGGEQGREIADVDERVGGDDKIERRRRLAPQQRHGVADNERVVAAALPRLRDHGRRKVDAGQMVDAVTQRLAHEAVATTDIQDRGEAAARRGGAHGFGDEGRGAVAERPGQVRFEARRILVEQTGDISRGKGRRRVSSPDQREPHGGALGVGRVGAKRRTKGRGGGVDLAQPLARFAEGEPCRRPVRRALQSLFEHFRRRAKISLVGRGPGVRKATLGERIARGERIASHPRAQRFLRLKLSK